MLDPQSTSCGRCGAPYASGATKCLLDGTKLSPGVDGLVGRSFGGWTVQKALGANWLSRVYLVENNQGESGVMKVLDGEFAALPQFHARFARGTKAAIALQHPNVVRVLEGFTIPSDPPIEHAEVPCRVSQFVEARQLSQVIASEGPLPGERVRAIARQLGLALGVAHEQGFVHRDVRPTSVWLTSEAGQDRPMLGDFDLVGLTEETATSKLTRQGEIIGRPEYMAPEQFDGAKATPAADVYALGVVMYQMLTARLPFLGTPREVATAKRSQPAPALTTTSGLEPLVARMLEMNREARPQNGTEVVDALDGRSPTPDENPDRKPGLWKKLFSRS